MSNDTELQHCNGLKWADVNMMAQASISLSGEPATVVEIRRGMTIISSERWEVGKVAGVAIHPDSRKAVCLILSHLPEEASYQSLPITWIACMEGETILLNVSFEQILAAPAWHPMNA